MYSATGGLEYREGFQMRDRWGRWHYTPYKKGEKIRIVFLFQAASVWASWESVYEACLNDDGIEVKILLLTERSVEKAQMLSAEKFLEEKKISCERYESFDLNGYRPHIAFVQFPYDLSYHVPDVLSLRLKERGIRIVYIPYGIEISDETEARRDHFENFVVENSWRLFTCCEAIKTEYLRYCRNRDAVRVCGSPKFDGLAHKEDYPLSQEYIKKADGRKIILWKIHFPKKIFADGRPVQITPELEEYIRFASGLESYGDLFFIVMAHPKMVHGMVGSDLKGDKELKDRADRLIRIIRRQENAVLDMSDDYRNSLYHADAVILDRSALIIEAAMAGKPVLLMRNGAYREKWTNGVRQVADTFIQGTAAADMEWFINSLQGLRQKSTEAIGKMENAGKTKDALSQYFPYRDGRCGYRIMEAIKKDLEEEGRKADHRIKVVLYGAGDVCGYYLEEGFKKSGRSDEFFGIAAIVDGNSSKWGTELSGYRIEPPGILYEINYDAVVIMTEQNYFEIKKKLVYGMFIDERRIWRLDEFLMETESVGKRKEEGR